MRGTGGRPTSFGEENLLSLPIDRYDDESIAVHEFYHTIDGALQSIDPDWTERRNTAFQSAKQKRLYRDAYAMSNPGEYWAEISQSFFDCTRVALFALVHETFAFAGKVDWRWQSVTLPASAAGNH